MTYAVLYHKETGTIYIYVNTHLDNADDGSIRVKQVNILMDLVADLPNYPTVLTGDFYIFLSDMDKFNALYYEVGNTSSRCSVYNRSDHYPLISKFALK